MDYLIRNEGTEDFRKVEEITRSAFWNIHVPGCNEHYLVHIMRNHRDFIPELDFVIEKDGKIIGNIMYTKAKLVNDEGHVKEIITFGPVSILPKFQKKGYGSKLIEYSISEAIKLGYDVIVIFGNPRNYIKHGFKSCKKYNVSLANGLYPTAMMVNELREVVLEDNHWTYKESEVYNFAIEEAEMFDKNFEKMEKRELLSQEEFYILSNSRMI